MVLLRQFANQFTGYNQGLFVGKSDGLSGFDGLYSRTQTGIADHSSHNYIYRCERHHLRDSISTCPHLAWLVLQSFSQSRKQCFISNAHHFGMKLFGLTDQQIYRSVRTNSIHSKPFGIIPNNIQRLCTYTAGTA